MTRSTFARIAIAATLAVAANAACPDVGSQQSFNLTAYTRHRWYIQELMAIQYEPVDFNFCVSAMYGVRSDGVVTVANTDRNGSITAEPRQANLCAVVADAKVPSKLKVGPCFLPSVFYGDYWVVRAGLYGQAAATTELPSYDWAIISGGQPTNEGSGGCRTGTGVNGAGLWLFTRDQIAPEGEIARVRSIANAVGFDITILNPVVQQDCVYSDVPRPAGMLRGLVASAAAQLA